MSNQIDRNLTAVFPPERFGVVEIKTKLFLFKEKPLTCVRINGYFLFLTQRFSII